MDIPAILPGIQAAPRGAPPSPSGGVPLSSQSIDFTDIYFLRLLLAGGADSVGMEPPAAVSPPSGRVDDPVPGQDLPATAATLLPLAFADQPAAIGLQPPVLRHVVVMSNAGSEPLTPTAGPLPAPGHGAGITIISTLSEPPASGGADIDKAVSIPGLAADSVPHADANDPGTQPQRPLAELVPWRNTVDGTPQVPARPVIDIPPQHPRWSQVFASRILWLVNDARSSARISLNPPELGPVEVRVQMHSDHTSINFYAQHGSVRDAIEAAFPRLRELFSQSGLALGDTNVFQQAPSREDPRSTGEPRRFSGDRRVDPAEPVVAARALLHSTLVDHYV